MVRRFTKEFKLEGVCNNIYLKYGTTNKYAPNVIYITGRMWLCPKYDGFYDDIISHIYKQFKKSIRHELDNCELFDDKFILDFDINAKNLVKDKKKFFEIQLFIKQNPYSLVDIKNLMGSITTKFGSIFKKLENNLAANDFVVSKTKTK